MPELFRTAPTRCGFWRGSASTPRQLHPRSRQAVRRLHPGRPRDRRLHPLPARRGKLRAGQRHAAAGLGALQRRARRLRRQGHPRRAANLNPTGRRTKYRFQLDGPIAAQIFAAAVDGEPPEIAFFRTAQVTITGHEVLVLRHGMAGHQGVEISGPFDDEAEVRDAILTAGEPYGIRPVGTQAYFSTPLSNALDGIPGARHLHGRGTARLPRVAARRRLGGAHQLGGSFVSPDIEDYYVTPYDLGYGHMVKFDHDFIGREALESLPTEKRRRRSFWSGTAATSSGSTRHSSARPPLQVDRAPRRLLRLEPVRRGARPRGTPVGVSCHAGYMNPDGELLSLAMLDAAHADPGTSWSSPGASRTAALASRRWSSTSRPPSGRPSPPPRSPRPSATASARRSAPAELKKKKKAHDLSRAGEPCVTATVPSWVSLLRQPRPVGFRWLKTTRTLDERSRPWLPQTASEKAGIRPGAPVAAHRRRAGGVTAWSALPQETEHRPRGRSRRPARAARSHYFPTHPGRLPGSVKAPPPPPGP